jgi:hypothetical protein
MPRASVRPGPAAESPAPGGAWYRQPVAWLAALVLLASLAVVAVTIVAAQRFRDEALPVEGVRVLKAPVSRDEAPAGPATQEAAE